MKTLQSNTGAALWMQQLCECWPFSCACPSLGEKTVWVCVLWFRSRFETAGMMYQSEPRSDVLHLAGRTVGGLCPSVQSDCRGEPPRSASCRQGRSFGAPGKTKICSWWPKQTEFIGKWCIAIQRDKRCTFTMSFCFHFGKWSSCGNMGSITFY